MKLHFNLLKFSLSVEKGFLSPLRATKNSHLNPYVWSYKAWQRQLLLCSLRSDGKLAKSAVFIKEISACGLN